MEKFSTHMWTGAHHRALLLSASKGRGISRVVVAVFIPILPVINGP